MARERVRISYSSRHHFTIIPPLEKKRKKSEIAPTTPVEPIDLDEMMDEQEKDSSFPPFDMALFLKNNVQVQIPPEIFLNEDILHRIFEHFDLQPGSRNVAQTRKDLLSAAKTCRAFVEPALNSLWRIIPSLLPLLLLLPSAKVKNGHYVSFRSSCCRVCHLPV